MGRIRTVKPEFFTDARVMLWDDGLRVFFIGLFCAADDHGRFRAEPSMLAASIWPGELSRDPRETLARVSDSLARLSRDSRIVVYEDPDGGGEQYGAIVHWARHQRVDRPGQSRIPKPPEVPSRDPRETLARPSRDPRDAARAREEQDLGSRKKEQEQRVREPTHACAREDAPPAPFSAQDEQPDDGQRRGRAEQSDSGSRVGPGADAHNEHRQAQTSGADVTPEERRRQAPFDGVRPDDFQRAEEAWQAAQPKGGIILSSTLTQQLYVLVRDFGPDVVVRAIDEAVGTTGRAPAPKYVRRVCESLRDGTSAPQRQPVAAVHNPPWREPEENPFRAWEREQAAAAARGDPPRRTEWADDSRWPLDEPQ